MNTSEYISALAEQGELLARAATGIDLDTRVPTCPEWNLRQLLTHIGGVHRWAASYVTSGRPDMLTDEEEGTLFGSDRPTDHDIVDWFHQGHTALLEALGSAPPDLACWTFMPAPSPVEFWARRQAHETAIHRVDVESISLDLSPFDAEFAADGVEELLVGFATRGRKLLSDPPRTLAVETSDTGQAWLIAFGPERVETTSGTGDAECTTRGRAADLYLALWNRLPVAAISTKGDRNVLARFREKLHIRWA
jgi:uncharacterized protein (TIGR03083 family)